MVLGGTGGGFSEKNYTEKKKKTIPHLTLGTFPVLKR